MKTSTLLANIKRTMSTPEYQNLFSELDLLALATEEARTTVAASLTSLREDYVYRQEEVALVPGQALYPIPSRAIARTLRDVILSDSDRKISLPRIALGDAYLWGGQSGVPSGFSMEGDFVRLLPAPSSATLKLLLSYFVSSPTLVPDAATAIFVAPPSPLTATTAKVYLGALPPGFVVGAKVDTTSTEPSYQLKASELEIVNISSSSVPIELTLQGPAVDIAMLSLKQSISLAGTSSFVQFPTEFSDLLVSATCVRIAEALGNAAQLDLATKRFVSKQNSVQMLGCPRVEGESKKVVNRQGLLRGRGMGYPYYKV